MKNMITNKASACQLRMLAMAVISFMTCTATQASVERHGDLEIYKKPQASAPVITLMLDVSYSMSIIDEPANGCNYNRNEPYEENAYGYTTYYCKSGSDRYYRRIDNLKMGVSDLVNSPELKGKVNLGVGTYPLSTANKAKAEVSGNGHIDIPANILDEAHASDINNFIKGLEPTWNTPIAQAYGEVGSYMMGTRTNKKVTTPYYLYRETYKDDRGLLGWGFLSGEDYECTQWESIDKNSISIDNALIKCKTWVNTSRLNPNVLDNNGHQLDRTEERFKWYDFLKLIPFITDVYKKVVAENDPDIRTNNIDTYPLIDPALVENKYSGFTHSADNTKNDAETNYKSPLPDSSASCAGNGIYFLTDGYPNQSNTIIAKSVMNNALEPLTGTQQLTVECSGDGTAAWPCILDFSQKLLDTQNPSGIEIKTATVGFGSAFSSIRSANTEAECEAGDNDDVKNLCKWGIRGKGGFYYADDSQSIVNSIKSLTGKLTEDIPPVSTGSMAVPLDDLNVSTSRKFAYLPLLDPSPLSPYKLWKGNLKKYNIKNGTLADQADKPVFTSKDGIFATNTSDLYNTLDTSRADAKRPDKALPQVGGSYQHIFENSNSRKLYVNDGGSLKNIGTDGITANAKPVGFDDLASYLKPQKAQLLNFLGYPVAADFEVKNENKIGVAFDRNKKQLGGVLHSLPQLISKKAELKVDGTIDNTKREDYVLYGSLDGALHVIRDTNSGSNKAGEEVFTFIPKHVLDQQGASFVDPERVADSPIFGVDGPWSVFTNYKYLSNKIEAQQSLAFGGLRMGGSMYYGLNLSDLTNPEMIYSVGSTYAIEGSASAKGVKNDTVANTTTNTNEQKAYAKMGLSFAQPSVGYVMKGGKRVMVNFLAGGYDRCYEDPSFKLGSAVTTNVIAGCNGKTSAQGSSIYMVQVGKEKTDTSVTEEEPTATNENSFDTTIDNGNLLWWTSSTNNGAGNANFTQATDMKHSVVTEIRTLDRNYDGLTDQLVFADLGGRVWRVDINNSLDSTKFKVERVAKILDLSVANTASANTNASGSGDAPPRIYEKPLVTFTRLGEGTDIVGLVTVGTGDRSSPITARREVADRIYTFVDRDIARPDLFCYDVKDTTVDECANVTLALKQSTAITPANLVPLTTNSSGEFTNDNSIKTKMDAYASLGWYLPLTSWSTTNAAGTQTVSTNNTGIKMFNQPDAIAGLLFTTVYNPEVGDTSGTCSAGVTGRTQREQLCLPYGVCMSKGVDASGNLTENWAVRQTRYLSNAGIGIVDNIISDGNFAGDTKNSVVVLENFCEGGDCSEGKQELIVDPITEELNCQGTSCKVVTESQLDPMQWKER